MGRRQPTMVWTEQEPWCCGCSRVVVVVARAKGRPTMATGPAVVREEMSASSGQAKGAHCCLFATGQSFAQWEACELISLVETVSEHQLVCCFSLVQIVSGMEWAPARIRLFVWAVQTCTGRVRDFCAPQAVKCVEHVGFVPQGVQTVATCPGASVSSLGH